MDFPALSLTALLVVASCARESRPGRHPDRAGAVQRCKKGYGDAASAASPKERTAIIWSACAGLYLESTCRDAFANVMTVLPHERSAYLTGACRDAYCPLLDEPKPSLCSMERHPFEERGALFAELLRRVHILELGEDAAEELRIAAWSNSRLPDPPPPATPSAVTPTWPTPVVGITSALITLSWKSPAGDIGPAALEVAPSDVCATLGSALETEVATRWPRAVDRPEASHELLLVVHPDVPYRDVLTVMECVLPHHHRVVFSTTLVANQP
jgi:hypothetical protein